MTVDGAIAQLGQRVDPAMAHVAVDGIVLPVAPDLAYYLVNKPRGVVSTASDPQGRPTVVELVPKEPRVFPVGRLDVDRQQVGTGIAKRTDVLGRVGDHQVHV